VGHADVVVGQEHDPVPHLAVVGEPDQLLDQRLAAVVGRVRLAGHHDLDRPLRVQQQRLDPVRVAQHQRQPLVRGHPAGEADGEHVRVEHRAGPVQLGVGEAALQLGGVHPAADLVDQPLAQRPAQRPQLLVRHLVQRLPAAGLLQQRVRAVPVDDLQQLPAHPGRRVHPVGDRGDRHLGDVEAGPQRLEHLPADHPVQPAHAVGPLGQPQAHVGHVEPAGIALGTELEHPLDRQRGPLRLVVVGPDHVLGEPVDAGRDRGVGGEHGARPHTGQRLVEAEPLGGQLAHPLQAEEAGVALVGVEHLGCRRAGQPAVRADRPHAADAGQHLLGHPVLAGPAVQLVGDLPLGGLVLLDVGVEQQQRHPADLDLPDLGAQRAAAGDGEGDLQRRAVRLPDQ
jgi:hypothetical protein